MKKKIYCHFFISKLYGLNQNLFLGDRQFFRFFFANFLKKKIIILEFIRDANYGSNFQELGERKNLKNKAKNFLTRTFLRKLFFWPIFYLIIPFFHKNIVFNYKIFFKSISIVSKF